jgi:hypothetical protein
LRGRRGSPEGTAPGGAGKARIRERPITIADNTGTCGPAGAVGGVDGKQKDVVAAGENPFVRRRDLRCGREAHETTSSAIGDGVLRLCPTTIRPDDYSALRPAML